MDSSSIDDPKDKKSASLNIYQYDAELALAFQADCEHLLNKFSNLQSYSFDAFARVWKETCFISIFEGQEYVLMLKAFMENCFSVVKKFLFSSNLYVQAGVIYILYALYYKQPIRQWVKIRLTQLETDKLNDIINFHKQNGRLEIPFICSKMRLDGAFQYCALTEPQSLNAKHLQRFDQNNENITRTGSKVDNPLEKFKTLMEDDPILNDLEETDREYQDLVNKYKVKCKQLFVFPSVIGNELKNAYNNVIKGCSSDSGESSEGANRLKQVKTRAMANTHAIYRAERSVITGTDCENFTSSK